MTDLNTLVTGTNPFSNLQYATAISGNGNYIVGYGTVGGQTHGFLLDLALLPGDANGDGKVDINDLTIVLANYNQSIGTNGRGLGDFNADQKVDINDLTIVLAHYNQGGCRARATFPPCRSRAC